MLNTLDGNTTGAVNASTVTTLTGTAADANTAYASTGITGLANEAVTLSDTSLAASVLNTLDGNTTGAVTNAASVTTLTGTAADAEHGVCVNSQQWLEMIGCDISVTGICAEHAIDGNTTGDTATVTTLTGTAADANTALRERVSGSWWGKHGYRH